MPDVNTPEKKPVSGVKGTVLILALGVALSTAAAQWVKQAGNRRTREQFERVVSSHMKFFEERRERYEGVLVSLRYLFASRGDGEGMVSAKEFRETARDLMIRNPGLLALEWVPVVPNAQRAMVEEAMRKEGFARFQISDRGEGGEMVPAGVRGEYLPILYVEPAEGNERAHGFDIRLAGSRPQQEEARDGNATAVTPVLNLIQQGLEPKGLIILLPVYGSMPFPEDLQGRRREFRGYVQAVCRVPQLFDSIVDAVALSGIDLLVRDTTMGATNRTLAFFPGDRARNALVAGEPPTRLDGEMRSWRPLELGSRIWEVQFRATPTWIAEHENGLEWFVLALGLGLTGAVGWAFSDVDRKRALVEREVELRTGELQAANVRLGMEVRERKQAESALLRAQSTLITAQRLGKIGSWDVDLRTDKLTWSQEMYRIFGVQEGAFEPTRAGFFQRVHPEDRERVIAASRQAIEGLKPYHVEHRIVLQDGRVRYLVEHAEIVIGDGGVAVQMVGAAQDVSENREQEREKERMLNRLQETQKLESLGILAGGIAHDFNNLLTGILGNASLLRLDLPRHAESFKLVGEIENEAVRAAELCRQMLAYAGKGRFVLENVDLTTLVQESGRLLKLSANKAISLRYECPVSIPPVYGDITQLRQILMNLVINASEAIGSDAGIITLRTGVVGPEALQESKGTLVPSGGEGDFVFLEVQDTGCGMDEATASKIFDPFFTTKFTGRGLGLAGVIGIVRGHRGFIEVESEPGRGSSFKVFLPRSREISASAPIARPESESKGVVSGDGLVLVVDDEDSIRRLAVRMLGNRGFDVISAKNGREGVTSFGERAMDVRLVLLDLTMPVMGGEETFREIRRMRSDMPVVLMSGFSEEETLARFQGYASVGFLQKPFTTEELMAAVGKAMPFG